MDLTPVTEKFILHWGEMGTRWGVSRSVAQIHALLYISPDPLPADEIMATLGIARSNVSMSLKELHGWGIVRVVHEIGDRRDHFEALEDVWELFRVILVERKKREADPTRKLLRECVEEAKDSDAPADQAAQAKLEEMLSFFELATDWGDRATALSSGKLKRLLSLGDSIFKLVAK